jgi:hypothetical protein
VVWWCGCGVVFLRVYAIAGGFVDDVAFIFVQAVSGVLQAVSGVLQAVSGALQAVSGAQLRGERSAAQPAVHGLGDDTGQHKP